MHIDTFQHHVWGWVNRCFGRLVASDITERCDRALEEHLELLQSLGYDRGRILALIDYVYNRPPGDPPQEVGGVMVTLAALCSAAGIDMEIATEEEIDRVFQPDVMQRIREKQASKRDIHSPLPGSYPMETEKKPYEAPKLTELGKVTDLTAGGSCNGPTGQGPNGTGNCGHHHGP